MPGQLFEGNPVDEGTTGRSTDAPVLTNIIVTNISQYIHMSNHYLYTLQLHDVLYQLHHNEAEENKIKNFK